MRIKQNSEQEAAAIGRGPRSTRSNGTGSNDENEHPVEQGDREKNRTDDATDHAGFGEPPALGVHVTGLYFLEVATAHEPGEDAEGEAGDDEAENTENENEGASVGGKADGLSVGGWDLGHRWCSSQGGGPVPGTLEHMPGRVGSMLEAAIIPEILRAVSPGPLVVRAFQHGLPGACHILAVGKASGTMAEAAVGVLGGQVRGGGVVGVDEKCPTLTLRALWGDHPVPTGRNVEAAREVLACVEECRADETLLVLLSGGASALLCLPREPLTLKDIADVTGALLHAGAPIEELNTVRKHCEVLKGGGLVRAAAAAGSQQVVCLILSDVLGDRLDVIGSGPTAPDPTTFAEALSVLEKRGALGVSPVVTALLHRGCDGIEPETIKPGDPIWASVENRVIGNNQLVINAACDAFKREGYEIVERREGVEGEAAEVGRTLACKAMLLRANGRSKVAIVWGGETTVTVGEADGKGGRCQELSLAAAILLGRHDCGAGFQPAQDAQGAQAGSLHHKLMTASQGTEFPRITIASLATDGRDGPTDAAGAVVDETTAATIRDAGIDPHTALKNHDSYHALKAARVLLRTGPTGTNINDLMVALVG